MMGEEQKGRQAGKENRDREEVFSVHPLLTRNPK